MNTLNKQRGLSMLAWSVIVAMSGIFILTGLKLTPVYLEYYNVIGIIDQMKNDASLRGAPKESIMLAFQRRMGVSDISSLEKGDYTITKVPGEKAFLIEIDYEVRRPLFGNLSIVVSFQRSEEVGSE